jgi:hypothetical protein
VGTSTITVMLLAEPETFWRDGWMTRGPGGAPGARPAVTGHGGIPRLLKGVDFAATDIVPTLPSPA